jgi:hypothetical protein
MVCATDLRRLIGPASSITRRRCPALRANFMEPPTMGDRRLAFCVRSRSPARRKQSLGSSAQWLGWHDYGADRGKGREARALLATAGWFSEGFDTGDRKDAKTLRDELAVLDEAKPAALNRAACRHQISYWRRATPQRSPWPVDAVGLSPTAHQTTRLELPLSARTRHLSSCAAHATLSQTSAFERLHGGRERPPWAQSGSEAETKPTRRGIACRQRGHDGNRIRLPILQLARCLRHTHRSRQGLGARLLRRSNCGRRCARRA